MIVAQDLVGSAISEVVVRIEPPGGASTNYRVPVRGIWRMGLNFLHGAFVHAGTPCVVVLDAVDGETLLMTSVVERCEHIEGTSHDIRLRFACEIELSDFVGRRAASTPDAGGGVIGGGGGGGGGEASPTARVYDNLALLASEVQALALDRVPIETIAERIRSLAMLCEQGRSLTEAPEPAGAAA